MPYLFVGDRYVDVFFDSSKVFLETEATDGEVFACSREAAAGDKLTAENLVEGAQHLVKQVVAHEQVAIDQQRVIEDAQRILGVLPDPPRRKFLGIL